MVSRYAGNGYALAAGIGASAGASVAAFNFAAAGGSTLNAGRPRIRVAPPAAEGPPAVPWWQEHVLLIVAGVAIVGAWFVWERR